MSELEGSQQERLPGVPLAAGPITWSRRGGYECSTKGDARFSALNARLPDGRSIEQHYQCDVKGYDPGGTNWRLGKGKPPLDPRASPWGEYLALWRSWAEANPGLLGQLRSAAASYGNRLADCFASSPINQARALAAILNEARGHDDAPHAHDCPHAAAAKPCGCGFCLALNRPRAVGAHARSTAALPGRVVDRRA